MRDDAPGWDEDEDPESDSEGSLDSEAEVTCLYCGEVITLELDRSSGESQDYVEDCQVCCRPLQVHVLFDARGTASVTLEEV